MADCPVNAVLEATYDNVIKAEALKGCTATVSVTMANSLQYIGIYAFYGCTNLENITWSDNIVEIGDRAFHDCKKLKKILLPPKVEKIGIYVFWGIPDLEELQFPETFRSGDVIFGNSPKAKMSVVNEGGTAFYEVKDDYYLYSNNGTTLVQMTPHPDITAFNLDTRCTTIGRYSCVYSMLGPVLTIPSHINTIREWVWQHAPALTKIVLGAGVTTMMSGTFLGIPNIAEFGVDTDNPLYSHHNGVVYNKLKTKLEYYPTAKADRTLVLPKSVMEFGHIAFAKTCPIQDFIFEGNALEGDHLKVTSDKKGLVSLDGKRYARCIPKVGATTDYTVPSGVEILGGFSETTVRDIILPSSCNYIQALSFYQSELRYINLSTITYCERSPFQGAKVTSLSIPGCWIVIRDTFARLASKLMELTIGEGIKEIEYQAFDTIPAQRIVLPQSLETIGQRAFYSTKVTSLELPSRCLNYIGEEAFAYSANLVNITIPKSVAVIDHKAFSIGTLLELAIIKNCETYWAYDAFLSTERKIQVVCIATKRFTDFQEVTVIQNIIPVSLFLSVTYIM